MKNASKIAFEHQAHILAAGLAEKLRSQQWRSDEEP
jgi:hypothetical protein